MTRRTSDTTIDRCLRTVWRRAQGRHLSAAVLAFACWGVPLFLGVVLLDWLVDLPDWLRAIAAFVVVSVALRQAWRQGGSSLRRFDPMRTALQIEHAQGGMESVLVTAVHFHEHGASAGTSAAMWERAASTAQEVAGRVAPGKIVSMAPLKRWLGIAAGVAAVLGVVAVLQGPYLAAGFGRVFTPWRAIAYPTDTQIDLGSGTLVIQEGAPATLTIGLAGKIPATAALSLQTGEGRPRELELEVVDGVCAYQIASASRDFSYRVRAGDARSEWRQVQVVSAPRMAEVKVTLDFPDYMDRPNETVEALTLTVPEETTVRWHLTLDTPIREATLHRDDADDLPLEVGPDGRTLTLSEAASASRGYGFSWTEDRHGFHFTSPRYFLQVASDRPPRVELVEPASNLDALLGRPLALSVRADDDHGFGATRIIYRVNRRPENVIELPAPVRQGEGAQPLDWDYRKELPDLAVGDSVTFLVEVADRYPGEGGPHRARSETRRIAFLSREDYLAQVAKRTERLLNRVRLAYRQERAAHALAVSLDPAAESFVATCQLEAIRQELIREQLVTGADDAQALLDDLAANQVGDAVESDALSALQAALRDIAARHVARAADLLRAQVGADTRDLRAASGAINEAARELAGLVLLGGIDAAREVFARETKMLAGELIRLRLRLVKADANESEAEALASDIEAIATWTDALCDRLVAGMRYDKRPLAVLGLSCRIRDLRDAGLTGALRAVAASTRKGMPESKGTPEPAPPLYPLIRPLLESEFTMRRGAGYAVVRALREQLPAWITIQERLQTEARAADDTGRALSALAPRQAALRDSLVLAAMPGIPAPRAKLSDLTEPAVPPGDERRLRAEALLTEAVARLEAPAKDEAVALQDEALVALRDLDTIVARWAVELAQTTLGVSSQLTDANQHITALEQFEARQIGLIEQTETIALDEKDPASLIEDMTALAEEVDTFRRELAGGKEVAEGVVPLIDRLEVASKAMARALTALRATPIDEAIEPEEEAAGALTEALGIARDRLARLSLQQQLIAFRGAVANAAAEMADVAAEQLDLIAAIAKADKAALQSLMPRQRHLHRCLDEVAPVLDVVAARLDVSTPLVFAGSDMEEALAAMKNGDAKETVEIQEAVVEFLTAVRQSVDEVAVQTGYVTEIVEFLHALQSDGSMLAFRQRHLREQGKPDDVPALQRALAADATAYGEALTMAAGQIDFQSFDEKTRARFAGLDLTLDGSAPAEHMAEAIRRLEAGGPADEAMMAAEGAFRSQAEHMQVIIAMLNGLPGIGVSTSRPPELHRLIAVLDVASKQRVLMRQTHAAADGELPSLAVRQQALLDALAKGAATGEIQPHPMLAKAQEQMLPVAGMLAAADKPGATAAQLAADQTLRHFIVEQALILNTVAPTAIPIPGDVVTDMPTDDLSYSEPVGFVSNFVSGEAPKDKKSEWEILGERNRAALNQNFARELPLEYRATLKNYYERVAQ